MSNIVIIQGHPDTKAAHLCHAMATAYQQGAQAQGHKVNIITPAQLDFPMLSSQSDWKRGEQGLPKVLTSAAQAMKQADHFVIIYPLWLGTMPAILKSFLEQTCRPGIALEDDSAGLPKGLFQNKSARIIITMGMPVMAYRWYFFAHSLKNLERNILKFIGIKPIKTSLFGMVDRADDKKIKQWLDALKALGAKAI